MIRLLAVLGLADVILRVVIHVRDEWGWFIQSYAYGDQVWVCRIKKPLNTLTQIDHVVGVFESKEKAVKLFEDAVGHKIEWETSKFSERLYAPVMVGFSIEIEPHNVGDDQSVEYYVSEGIEEACKLTERKGPFDDWAKGDD